MLVSDFDFRLPPELIAQVPLPERDASRMMFVERRSGRIRHMTFREFPGLVGPADLLVLNDTKVIPARAWGRRGGATVEFLFIGEREPGAWEVMARPARRLRTGERVIFPDGSAAEVVSSEPDGRRVLKFPGPDVRKHLARFGHAPLPPYIKRAREESGKRAEDLVRYQTVFAANEGAVAAPTAGLHFTRNTLRNVRLRGANIARVTLAVGPATFQPVRVEKVEDHRMLEEAYEISAEAASAVTGAKKRGIDVLAVGTTVVRTLESAWDGCRIAPGSDMTSLFIRPGFRFRVVDRLLTNFHLPKSTLLMLVSAFAGRDLVLEAYHEAVRERYRFFSYGDCMLIV